MKAIFDFAGYTILHLEEIVSDQKNTKQTMSPEQIKQMREEKYDEVCEEFIDEIFGYEAKLTRKEFE